ncbi:50S ribosomal protein L13 [Candidatus Woesearchaeota archaeon]|nr:50S ribosomal protein L13 [Candidatus Woesearchaeota archaeon]
MVYKMIIIDAQDKIVGRIATIAAKKALLGEKIEIINCENAVISGKKKYLISEYKRQREMGIPSKGPFIPRLPDRYVRRIVRGMLPTDTPRGREAYKRVMCHTGKPSKLEGEVFDIKGADYHKLPTENFIKIGELLTTMGGNMRARRTN